MRVLITGGAGFIGHHVVNHLLVNTHWHVTVLDKLTYAASGFDRLRDISCFDHKRVTVLTSDFTHPISDGVVKELGAIDYIVHMGAETHVDRSILEPTPFVMTNVVGTMHMLDLARKIPGLRKFVYFSTDEIFGPAPEGVNYKEWDRYNSTNPYSASKAGGEELCLAYSNTYGVPLTVTHTMNVFGERQNEEKFIPMCIKKILREEKVLIHADSLRVQAGSRMWIHARNVADALVFLLTHTTPKRDKFNIVGEREVDNLSMAQIIAGILKKPLFHEMVDFHSQRPGHDLRYALDGTKLAEFGWKHPLDFNESLINTIEWYLKPENIRWLGL